MTENKTTVAIQSAGTFEFTAQAFDLVVERHLPNSIIGLRRLVAEATVGDPNEIDGWLAEVGTAFELLAVLADFETGRIENEWGMS